MKNQTPGPKVPVVSEEIVKKTTGELVKINRGEGGKFVKQAKTMPKSADVTRLMRKMLAAPIANADGKISKGAETRFVQMFNNIYEIARTSPHQPILDKFGNAILDEDGKVVTAMDAKCAMASVQAWKELNLRAYGMPTKSDEELDALKTQGVKIVILQHPEMMDKNVVEDAPRPKLEPAFAEVTEITTNEE